MQPGATFFKRKFLFQFQPKFTTSTSSIEMVYTEFYSSSAVINLRRIIRVWFSGQRGEGELFLQSSEFGVGNTVSLSALCITHGAQCSFCNDVIQWQYLAIRRIICRFQLPRPRFRGWSLPTSRNHVRLSSVGMVWCVLKHPPQSPQF